MPRFFAAVSFLALVGCSSEPDQIPPPQNTGPVSVFQARRGTDWNNVVADIYPSEGSWSWTGKRPTVKVLTPSNSPIHYSIDFSLVDGGLAQTGPISVQFFVNDHILDTVRYDKPGAQHYEKEVSSDWLSPGQEAIVGAEIDKIHTAPSDKRQLGFILSKIGLLNQ